MSAVLLSLFLLQQAPATGELPRVVASGVRRGVFPGAVVVMGTRDSIVFAGGFGHFTWSPNSAVPSPDSTLYDVASLTKVLATTPAIMRLVERGLVELDAPVSRYLPDFTGAGKAAVTVRHLLVHTSGLRAFLRLDTLARDAAGARRVVMSEPLRWPPGRRVEYSDLNAMLLGWVVESVSGESLDRFVARELFPALGLTHARFNPPRAVRTRVAPTGLWRGYAIAGEVHDQNAARLGGVSGHAGLFASGLDIARFAQVFLNRGLTPDGRPVFRPETVERFTRRQAENRALGWELRDTASSDNAGRLMGPRAYGHTGFTGTSLWIDPDRGVFVVILTNRVYAPRTRTSITLLKQIRGEIADVAASFDGGCGAPVLASSPAAQAGRPSC
jgi:CubicO group peptidase (beta-lactamase class C family)